MASRNHDAIKNDPRWKAARLACFERDDYTCVDCGTTEQLQADHVIPLDALFADGITPEAIDLAIDVDNLATRCRPCNASKGARTDIEFERNDWVHPTYISDLNFIITETRERFLEIDTQKSPASSFFTREGQNIPESEAI